MRVYRSFLLIVCATTMSFTCGCAEDNPGKGNELAAAHILITHKYSSGRPPNITRTQIEALELAKEVVEKARATGADFAALAKEYSESPTGPAGGDLGIFSPITMARPFSEATQALEIGAISDPVRTPFGYHIILRKQP
ncbi:MAG: peptidyl-prolyl cis-trans isomerase [Fuerstiella sp.]|nr:peptidyl-prolyl cis-trans isomerase [Fuerstiella sp.]